MVPKITCSVSIKLTYHFLNLVLIAISASAFAQTEDTQKQLDEVIKDLNQQQTWITEANKEIKELQQSVKEADHRVASTADQLIQLNVLVDDLRTIISDLQIKQQNLKSKNASLAKSVGWHMRREYQLIRIHWLRGLLSDDDPNSHDSSIRVHHQFIKARTQTLAEYKQSIDE